MISQRALLLYAALHAILYCSLLPLWEGYDEPFHYGYVQNLARQKQLPVLDRTNLSEEIWQSMSLVPASWLNARSMPRLTSYGEYFGLPNAERLARMECLRALPAALRGQATGPLNYEAQQPPLAYLPLLPIEWIAGDAPLPLRIWIMRVLVTLASLALLLWATEKLGVALTIPDHYRIAAAFLLVSTQNLYGAVGHIANEWLSVPLVAILCLAAERFCARPSTRTAALLALALAAGLLTKSYFLVFVPFAAVLVFWRGRGRLPLFIAILAVLAVPWYARNWLLYHSLAGLQADVRAIPADRVLHVFLSTPWPSTLLGLARAALWTANNSFTTFSIATLNVLLLLLAMGFVMRAWTYRKQRPACADAAVIGGSLIFAIIPIYATCLFGALFGQAYPNANSWYSAGLLPAVFLLSCAGFSRGGSMGLWTARALLCAATYVVSATYFAKLIPMYAGYSARARPSALLDLYGNHFPDLLQRLGQSAMAGGGIVVALAFTVAGLAVLLCVLLCRALKSA